MTAPAALSVPSSQLRQIPLASTSLLTPLRRSQRQPHSRSAGSLTVRAQGVSGTRARGGSGNGAVREILLVDPLRAKQLAEEDMARRRSREREQRFRKIEAINGAWAVLGVTAALLGEGVTGEGILGQVSLYLTNFSLFLEGLETKL